MDRNIFKKNLDVFNTYFPTVCDDLFSLFYGKFIVKMCAVSPSPRFTYYSSGCSLNNRTEAFENPWDVLEKTLRSGLIPSSIKMLVKN